jgi:uncharacterized membrane protein YdjX (TVP38/TMEM64 family)
MTPMPENSPKRSSISRFIPLGVLILAGVLFVAFGGLRYRSFGVVAEHCEGLRDFAAQGGIGAALAFVLGYAGLVALSLPVAAFLSVTSGFLFGSWLGAVYAVLGATIGATIVFLAVRVGIAGLVERAGPRVRRLEAGFRDDALSYLLVLRLIPIFPFWLVNLAAGAVGLRLPVYVFATLVGMIPTSFVYASLGNGLGDVLAQGEHPDLAILYRPSVLLPIIGLAVLALLPVFYKRWRGARSKQPA